MKTLALTLLALSLPLLATGAHAEPLDIPPPFTCIPENPDCNCIFENGAVRCILEREPCKIGQYYYC